jgi:hypothetical protein
VEYVRTASGRHPEPGPEAFRLIQAVASGIGSVITWAALRLSGKRGVAPWAVLAMVGGLIAACLLNEVAVPWALSGAIGAKVAGLVPPDVRDWRLPGRV